MLTVDAFESPSQLPTVKPRSHRACRRASTRVNAVRTNQTNVNERSRRTRRVASKSNLFDFRERWRIYADPATRSVWTGLYCLVSDMQALSCCGSGTQVHAARRNLVRSATRGQNEGGAGSDCEIRSYLRPLYTNLAAALSTDGGEV